MSSYDKHKYRAGDLGFCQFVNTVKERCGFPEDAPIHLKATPAATNPAPTCDDPVGFENAINLQIFLSGYNQALEDHGLPPSKPVTVAEATPAPPTEDANPLQEYINGIRKEIVSVVSWYAKQTALTASEVDRTACDDCLAAFDDYVNEHPILGTYLAIRQ